MARSDDGDYGELPEQAGDGTDMVGSLNHGRKRTMKIRTTTLNFHRNAGRMRNALLPRIPRTVSRLIEMHSHEYLAGRHVVAEDVAAA